MSSLIMPNQGQLIPQFLRDLWRGFVEIWEVVSEWMDIMRRLAHKYLDHAAPQAQERKIGRAHV